MIPALFGIAKLFAPFVLPKVVDAITDKNPTAGAVADAVVKVASQVTGIPIATEADAQQALATIQADPALQLQMIRQTDEATAALLKLDNEDRADARAREIATQDETPRTLAFAIIGGFLGAVLMILIAVLWGDPNMKDPTVAGLVGTVIGYLSAKAEQVASYYFGSSAGSKAKTEQMAAALRR